MGLILVDTSVWVDHLDRSNPSLAQLLLIKSSIMHPFVLGEIALGNLPQWQVKVDWLRNIRSAEPVQADIFMTCLAELRLQGSGLGFVDAHLLAWTVTAPDRKLWSNDRRLAGRAASLGVGWSPVA